MTTAIYDDRCVICRQTKNLVTALDWLRRIKFLDLHDWNEVNRLYPQLDYEQAMGQMHVATDDGQLIGGFPAVRRLLRDLPLGYPVWLLLHLPGMNALGNVVYRFVARHRYTINKLVGAPVCEDGTCKIHSG